MAAAPCAPWDYRLLWCVLQPTSWDFVAYPRASRSGAFGVNSGHLVSLGKSWGYWAYQYHSWCSSNIKGRCHWHKKQLREAMSFMTHYLRNNPPFLSLARTKNASSPLPFVTSCSEKIPRPQRERFCSSTRQSLASYLPADVREHRRPPPPRNLRDRRRRLSPLAITGRTFVVGVILSSAFVGDIEPHACSLSGHTRKHRWNNSSDHLWRRKAPSSTKSSLPSASAGSGASTNLAITPQWKAQQQWDLVGHQLACGCMIWSTFFVPMLRWDGVKVCQTFKCPFLKTVLGATASFLPCPFTILSFYELTKKRNEEWQKILSSYPVCAGGFRFFFLFFVHDTQASTMAKSGCRCSALC